MAIRTLILSGGGGRGAFHAGVYKYLSEANKEGVQSDYQGAWSPDVVVGTSIGAVNGAAIVQGIPADELVDMWLKLREHHIQGLPPGMRQPTRFITNWILKRSIGVKLQHIAMAKKNTASIKPTSPISPEAWSPIPFLPKFLSERLIGRWSNLLDTGPLLESMQTRLGLNPEKINASEKLLLIEATNVRTGEQVTFCNRPTGLPHEPNMKAGITLQRILASCSIPLIYPWTQDDGEYYWDGAVVANTPLGDAIDAVQDRPSHEKMEAIVVLMTPWWEVGQDTPRQRQQLPQNFGEAITWTLDWALLASFRVSLELTRMYNKQVKEALAQGIEHPDYREVDVTIIAPEDFLPVTRIIDYDETSSQLIDMGYNAAKLAFQKQFGK